MFSLVAYFLLLILSEMWKLNFYSMRNVILVGSFSVHHFIVKRSTFLRSWFREELHVFTKAGSIESKTCLLHWRFHEDQNLCFACVTNSTTKSTFFLSSPLFFWCYRILCCVIWNTCAFYLRLTHIFQLLKSWTKIYFY